MNEINKENTEMIEVEEVKQPGKVENLIAKVRDSKIVKLGKKVILPAAAFVGAAAGAVFAIGRITKAGNDETECCDEYEEEYSNDETIE